MINSDGSNRELLCHLRSHFPEPFVSASGEIEVERAECNKQTEAAESQGAQMSGAGSCSHKEMQGSMPKTKL